MVTQILNSSTNPHVTVATTKSDRILKLSAKSFNPLTTNAPLIQKPIK